jgi:membrane protein DedA with SNARE-associated domain/rhodanese-related sulfurtransferase
MIAQRKPNLDKGFEDLPLIFQIRYCMLRMLNRQDRSMLRELIVEYGLPLVFANVLLESLGLPVPALPTLILTGAITAASTLDSRSFAWLPQLPLIGIVVVAMVAALLGDLLWFWLGRRFGSRVLKLLCKLSISRDTCVNRSVDFFGRFGVRVLAVSKFIPGLSTLAIPVAGATGIAFSSFLVYDAIGAALWAVVGVALGTLFSGAVDTMLAWLDWLGRGAIAIAAAALLAYVASRWWHRMTLIKRLRMTRIDIEQLRALLSGEPPPVVVDARREQHRVLDPYSIPGALLLHDGDPLPQLADLPRNRKVVMYCNCPNEVSAALIAQDLTAHGFQDVAPLLGGLDAWRAAGYALEPVLLKAAAKDAAHAMTKPSQP